MDAIITRFAFEGIARWTQVRSRRELRKGDKDLAGKKQEALPSPARSKTGRVEGGQDSRG